MAIDAAFTRFPRLTTDRLVLRAIQPGDAEALFPIFSDADAILMQTPCSTMGTCHITHSLTPRH